MADMRRDPTPPPPSQCLVGGVLMGKSNYKFCVHTECSSVLTWPRLTIQLHPWLFQVAYLIGFPLAVLVCCSCSPASLPNHHENHLTQVDSILVPWLSWLFLTFSCHCSHSPAAPTWLPWEPSSLRVFSLGGPPELLLCFSHKFALFHDWICSFKLV